MARVRRDPTSRVHGWILWALLIGSVVVVVALRGLSGDGVTSQDIFAVLIAVSAVCGYAIYAGTQRANLPISPDQAGDNAYYIGLVLTFASLGVALVKLVVAIDFESPEAVAEGQAKRIAHLIPDFGVALASTVAGIIARLALQQQRQSAAEASEQARRDLDEAVRDFSRKLRIATGEIAAATNTVRLGVAKQLEDAVQSQIETFEAAQKRVRDAADTMAGGMSELADRVAAANLSMGEELDRIREASPGACFEELTDSGRQAGEALTSIQNAATDASGRIAAVAANLESLATRLQNFAPANDAGRMRDLVARTVDETQRALDEIARAGTGIDTTNALIDGASVAAAEAQQRTTRVAGAIRGVEDAVESVRVAIDGDDGKKGIAIGVRDSANALNGRIGDVERDIGASAQAVDQQVASVGNEAKALLSTLDDAGRGIATASGELSRRASEFAQEASKMSAQVGKLHRDADHARRAAENGANAIENLAATGDAVDALRTASKKARGEADALAGDIQDTRRRVDAAVSKLEVAAAQAEREDQQPLDAPRSPQRWPWSRREPRRRR